MQSNQTLIVEILQWCLIAGGVGLILWVLYCIKKVSFKSAYFWNAIGLAIFSVTALFSMYNYHFKFKWWAIDMSPTLWWHPTLYMAGLYAGRYALYLKKLIETENGNHSKIDEILFDFRKVTAELQNSKMKITTPLDILASYITHLPLPAWIKAKDGRMMAINSSYSKAYGITLDEYNSNYDAKNWGDPTATKFKKHDDIVLATHEEVFAYEEIENPTTLNIQRLEVVKFPIWDNGQVIAVAGLVKGYV